MKHSDWLALVRIAMVDLENAIDNAIDETADEKMIAWLERVRSRAESLTRMFDKGVER